VAVEVEVGVEVMVGVGVEVVVEVDSLISSVDVWISGFSLGTTISVSVSIVDVGVEEGDVWSSSDVVTVSNKFPHSPSGSDNLSFISANPFKSNPSKLVTALESFSKV